ncbi:alpha/beta hydrolase [Micromonospora sp. WMMD882]|uniref:alpha/beta fold hydrolase n=1 Tax=Micromonospora sp. WMMD882 TaxID=3015151 RepID=UPI00248AAC4A|nr:alpha/beta hydrolase [Micromonospora sp. WMMD882]WBB80707.1 alpha/beta hydrolase [Micromonospora sp. WMMD882]
MVTETDVALPDGRVLHVYDTGGDGPAVFWHHGTPNVGTPPRPLRPLGDRLGLRWLSCDRPGYGGSTPHPGRSLASVAADVACAVDALGVDRFAVFGHSGGGSFALACGALLAERVLGVVAVAAVAPYDAAGLDWFAGMSPAGRAGLRAAAAGRAAKEAYEATNTDGDPGFVAADWAALEGEWGWFDEVVRPALAGGPGAMIDDDLGYVAPWGCDPAQVTAPVLVLHGGADRVVPAGHGEWLARRCPSAEWWLRPDDGHLSVLRHAGPALEWLHERMR